MDACLSRSCGSRALSSGWVPRADHSDTANLRPMSMKRRDTEGLGKRGVFYPQRAGPSTELASIPQARSLRQSYQ